jgi:uncharacterized protein (DUF2235 family)
MSDTTPGTNPDVKRLALFLDGTWNTISSNTNVWRMKSLCSSYGHNSVEQRIYYNKGLGTSTGEIVRGGVFGYGVDEVVIDAYEWLIENYDNGDEIFIFGFSRGAYTARSLSGFISRCGLLIPGAPLSISQLYDRYKKGNDAYSIYELKEHPDNPAYHIEEKWMLRYSRAVPVKFTGVWDTVGSMSESNHFTLLTGGNHAFLDTNLRRSQTFAYHALAIDEHRKAFAPTLLTKFVYKSGINQVPDRPLNDVEQRWFVGAHANVGGGSANDLLSQAPLKWMMERASHHGLSFRHAVDIEDDLYLSPIEDSFAEFMRGAYRLAELGRPFYRKIAAPPEERSLTTVHTINETIDASVFEYWRRNENYRYQNLTEWAAAHSVDINTLHTSVRADDPHQTVSD